MVYIYLGMFVALPAALFWLSREMDTLIEQLPELARDQLRLRSWE